MRARHRRPGTRHEGSQPRYTDRVGPGAGPQLLQVRARALVQRDQFIGLGTAQPAPPTDQGGQSVPFGLMRHGVRVYIHATHPKTSRLRPWRKSSPARQ